MQILRPNAATTYAEELKILAEIDSKPRPQNWELSPWAVVTYILGGKLDNGFQIEPKYFGNRRIIEIAVATLLTDRALLLMGVPGTGKTWLSEHLSTAISGQSNLLIQGTAGINEDAMRYSWNYAKLLSQGPTLSAVVASPIMKGMRNGQIVRIEELTRIPADVQDTLITILSEKVLPVPELNLEEQAIKGFNVIATANNHDKGVNDLSSALKRRFNTVILPLPATLEEEIIIVKTRIDKLGKTLGLETIGSSKEIERLVTIFRELREGKTIDGKYKLKIPSSTLSTAEAISVINNSQVLATYFGNGEINANDLASSLIGAIVKEPKHDKAVLLEYIETVIKEKDNWQDLYRACKEVL